MPGRGGTLSSTTAHRGRRLLGDSAAVAAGLAVAQVLGYGLSVVAARALGPADFGVFGAMLGLILIGNVAALAVQAVGARRLVLLSPADRPAAARQVVRAAVVAGIVVAAVTTLASPLLAWGLHLDGVLPPLLVAAALVPLTVTGAQLGIAQGAESFGRVGWVYVCTGVGKSGVGLAGALATHSPLGALGGFAIGAGVGALAGQFVVAPLMTGSVRVHEDGRDQAVDPRPTDDMAGSARPTGPKSPALVRFSRPAAERVGVPAGLMTDVLHAGHALLALFVLTNIDVLLARHVLAPDLAGQYAAGAVVAKIAFWLPQVVSVIAFPRLVDDRRRSAAVRAVVIVAALGLLVTLGTALLPGLVVAAVAGSAYAALAPTVWIFAAAGSVLALGQLLLYARLAVDDRRAVLVVWTCVGVLVSAVLVTQPTAVVGVVAWTLGAGLLLVSIGLLVQARESRGR